MSNFAPISRKVEYIAPWKPYPWQLDPFYCTDPVMLLAGAAGGGKSRLAAEKLHAYLMHYPGATGLLLRKTKESLANTTVLFMQHAVFGDDPRIRYKEDKSRFEYSNGSMLMLGGMKDEGQRERIRGIGLEGGVDITWMEEAHLFTELDFNEIIGRMRGRAAPWRQIMLSTNPSFAKHWINVRLIRGKGATTFLSRPEENPANPKSYIEGLKSMTGVLRKRLYEGLWVSNEGAVYAEVWDPDVHIVPHRDIPNDWPRLWSFDFGYTNPFVWQNWAIDEDGRMWLIAQMYGTQRLVEDWAFLIKQWREKTRDPLPIALVCDHDAEGRATLERHLGLMTEPAQKAITDGIQTVKSRLKIAGDGKPRMLFMEDSILYPDEGLIDKGMPWKTEDEFDAYSWPPGGTKEVPMDQDNHGMDGTRYAAKYLEDNISSGIGGVHA